MTGCVLHAGQQLVGTAAAGGVTIVPLLAAVAHARVQGLVRSLRRRPR